MADGEMMNRPNILCFVTDQHRADHLGCAGNPDVKTPHLDALATDGLRFERSYVANPVCSPNRASMFTGQYPKAHRLRENGNALSLDAVTLPQVLKDHGYQTFSSGKLHLAPYGITSDHDVPESWKTESKSFWNEGTAPFARPYYGLDQVYFVGGHGHYNFGEHRNGLEPSVSRGYLREHAKPDSELDEEVWCSDVPEDQHYNTQIADNTIAFINGRDPKKPFFGWCSFPDPHHPFSPPEPWHSMYKGDELSVDPATDEGDDGLPDVLRAFKERMRVAEDCLPECIAKNYGMISMVDHNIGRVVQYLREQGLYENTIIVFFSDHGDYMGDHGLLRKGLMPYDGLYRVPTIWRIPDTTRTTGVTDALHSSVDLMPTLLELVDVNIPEGVQGVSQVPVLHGRKPTARETVFAEYDHTPTGQRVRFLRDDRHAFAYAYGAEFGMLYDMETDPQQQVSLFADPAHGDVRNRFFRLLAGEAIRSEPWLPRKVCHA